MAKSTQLLSLFRMLRMLFVLAELLSTIEVHASVSIEPFNDRVSLSHHSRTFPTIYNWRWRASGMPGNYDGVNVIIDLCKPNR